MLGNVLDADHGLIRIRFWNRIFKIKLKVPVPTVLRYLEVLIEIVLCSMQNVKNVLQDKIKNVQLFFQLLFIQTLDPDPDSLEMLDPHPDPQH